MRLATLRTAAGAALFLAPAALAQTAQPLPFSQDWSNKALITVDNVWTGVPGIVGYRGDDLSMVIGIDPQTVLADGSTTPLSILANKTSPGTELSGGNYEFELANPTVAFQGSNTADVPHIVIRVVTTGMKDIRVRYNLRDLDDGTFTPTGTTTPLPVDAIQQVALHFRVGTTGAYTNVPEGFVTDASDSPTATKMTPVDVVLPAAANGQASVDIRIMTANAPGSDEMIGVDDIQITGTPSTAAGETPNGALTLAVANPLRGDAQVRFSTATAQDVRLAVYDVLGRQVATLANGVVSGAQSATLNTAALAPGVYVLRLTAGADVLTQTVTVVR